MASIEKSAATTTHYVHNDHLTGSNIQSNSSGTSDEVIDYLPFGKVRLDQASTTFKQRKKFTGHEFDADTSLNYMQARYQDGRIGRFTSQDSVARNFNENSAEGKIMLMDPQLQNTYSYVGNNPLGYRDPNGEFLQVVAAVAGGGLIGGAIGGAVSAISGNGFWSGAKSGAISGATAGLIISTAGAAAPLLGLTSAESLVLGSAVGNAAGGTLARTADGQPTSAGDVGVDLVTGGAGGMIGVGGLKYQGSMGKSGDYVPSMSVKDLPSDAKKLLNEYESNGWSKAQSGPTGDPHPWQNHKGELPSKGTVFDAQYAQGRDRGIERFGRVGNQTYYSNTHYGENPPGSIPFFKLKK